jgi:hypothetical protein
MSTPLSYSWNIGEPIRSCSEPDANAIAIRFIKRRFDNEILRVYHSFARETTQPPLAEKMARPRPFGKKKNHAILLRIHETAGGSIVPDISVELIRSLTPGALIGSPPADQPRGFAPR